MTNTFCLPTLPSNTFAIEKCSIHINVHFSYYSLIHRISYHNYCYNTDLTSTTLCFKMLLELLFKKISIIIVLSVKTINLIDFVKLNLLQLTYRIFLTSYFEFNYFIYFFECNISK